MADLRRTGSTILRQGSVLSRHSGNCCCGCDCCDCPTEDATETFCPAGYCGDNADCASGTYVLNLFDLQYATCCQITLRGGGGPFYVNVSDGIDSGDKTLHAYGNVAADLAAPCACMWGLDNSTGSDFQLDVQGPGATDCSGAPGTYQGVRYRLWKTSATNFRLIVWTDQINDDTTGGPAIIFMGDVTVASNDCCIDLEIDNSITVECSTVVLPKSIEFTLFGCTSTTATYPTVGFNGYAILTKCCE